MLTAPKAPNTASLQAHLTGSGLGLQGLNLCIFAGRCALQLMGELGLSQGNRVAFLPLGQLLPLVQLLGKIAIAHLLEDFGVFSFVALEGFAAVRADVFTHGD
ncbi:hypothetical protein [Acidovorax sp. 69]|uniref:hypothetical protein n=1 Tax=Acidovorax sp. 69 TaxID=2035202 RepID=UPI000C244E94|nr:hypothetical protein [Acidovorax sp. 69]